MNSDSLEIRQFAPADAPECLEILRSSLRSDPQLPEETLEHLIEQESVQSICARSARFYLAVADLEAEVVGFGGLDLNEIRLLLVKPGLHRRGIGSALLAHLESLVPAAMFQEIFLYAQLAAEGFYARRGYRSKGVWLFDAGGISLETVWMVKPLA